MASFSRATILLAILLNFCLAVFANLEEATIVGQSDVEKQNDLGDDEDYDDRQLQQNFQHGFLKMMEFFKSTNSVLTSINTTLKRLDDRMNEFEEQMDKINTTVNQSINEVQDLKAENVNFRLELSELKENLETTEPPETTTTKSLTPEEFLRSLTPVRKGNSFNGLTTEQIANAIPEYAALAVEIENLLDEKLTDYQVDLEDALEHQKAPTIVLPKSSEVFTFKRIIPHGWFPRGVLSYRIENTGFSLHLFLRTGLRFAAAFLDNNSPVQTLWEMDNSAGCSSSFTHSVNPGTFGCIEGFNWNTKKTFLIHKDSFYAKLNVDSKHKSSILKIEVFKYEPGIFLL